MVQVSRSRLPRSFYHRPTLVVARELLGRRLVRISRGRRLSGLIVETEAYIGEEDSASHAFRGFTPRNAVMYGPPGHAYVYFTYGRHWCLNLVTEEEGFPAAVLLRAIIPDEGMEIMHRRRNGRGLADGPAKLCQALVIDKRFNGADAVEGPHLFLERGSVLPRNKIRSGPRVGIRGADARSQKRPWRFWVERSI
ncbi:MAG: DNA-3-methyladenine glycosylase [Chloroflexi bacterium]|nr:DNA-3-methyladenine glycosylase [Chloroflexota bacterium]